LRSARVGKAGEPSPVPAGMPSLRRDAARVVTAVPRDWRCRASCVGSGRPSPRGSPKLVAGAAAGSTVRTDQRLITGEGRQRLLGPCVLGRFAEHTFRYAADATASDADFAVVIHSADAGPRRVSGWNTMNGYFRCFLPYPASSERKLRSCGIRQFCSPKNLCLLQMTRPVRCASRHGLLGPQFSWLPRLRCLVGVSSRSPAASRRRGSHQRLP
jgi:hypothetical protein